MKRYNSKITLDQTSRGVWGFDTVKGCKYGMALDQDGCYGCCYASSIAKRYGFNFSDSTLRGFDSKSHMKNMMTQIKNIESDFIRIGVMGDPSECWGHTIDICDMIKSTGKRIVLITKHWRALPSYLYNKVRSLDLIINTSISALDSDSLIEHRLNEFNKLKNVCKSILRIVSCDFNLNTIQGIMCNKIQESLFDNNDVIDTVLRISSDHQLIKNGIINTTKTRFMSSIVTASIKNKRTHIGYCSNCLDRCGTGFIKNKKGNHEQNLHR